MGHMPSVAAHLLRKASNSMLAAGIVQGKGKVTELQQKQNFRSIHVSFPPGKTDGIQIGASVAINGTCLTVSSHSDAGFRF